MEKLGNFNSSKGETCQSFNFPTVLFKVVEKCENSYPGILKIYRKKIRPDLCFQELEIIDTFEQLKCYYFFNTL